MVLMCDLLAISFLLTQCSYRYIFFVNFGVVPVFYSTVSDGVTRQLRMSSALRSTDDDAYDVTQFTRYPGNGTATSAAGGHATPVT